MGINFPPNEEELYRRTDEVLHYLWDPIGISDTPQARSEYQSYVPQVFALLKQSATQQEIADYLSVIATDRMGLSANPSHSQSIASILLEWKNFLLPSNA